MTKHDQKQFLSDLIIRLLAGMVEDIDAGKVPAEWDGIELRCWLFTRVQDKALSHVTSPCLDRRTKRGKAFLNTLIVNNL